MTPQEILAGTTARVLEEIAFVLVDAVEDADLSDTLTASVSFQGPTGGRLGITIHRGLLEEALGNALSEESADGEVKAFALELANIVTGAVLDDWWGPRGSYDLGLPTLASVSGETDILLADELGRGVRVSVHTENAS